MVHTHPRMGTHPPTDGYTPTHGWVHTHPRMGTHPPTDGYTPTHGWIHTHPRMGTPTPTDGYTPTHGWAHTHTHGWVHTHPRMGTHTHTHEWAHTPDEYTRVGAEYFLPHMLDVHSPQCSEWAGICRQPIHVCTHNYILLKGTLCLAFLSNLLFISTIMCAARMVWVLY